MRTQAEIVERMKAIEKDDFCGFAQGVLLTALDYEHAKPFLKEDVTAEVWEKTEGLLKTEEAVRKEALDYLGFAWGKAEDHRGISANRSVDKMTAFCFLLGLDVGLIEAAPYPQYGCPKLKVVAELLGQPLPTSQALQRMMGGDECYSGCEEGCGA